MDWEVEGAEKGRGKMSAASHLNHHRTVFVSGLPDAVTREVLMGAFIPFGDIAEYECDVVGNGGRGRKKKKLR